MYRSWVRLPWLSLVLLAYSVGGSAQDTGPSRYGLSTVATVSDYQRMIIMDSNQALVALNQVIPGITLDIRYASSNNLMHMPMYTLAAAFMRRPAAMALKEVEDELGREGYGVKIYDAYRPYRVTVAFYEQYHDTNFVASPYTGSRHNRGCAVDLTLIDLTTGKELAMPTPFDSFTAQASATYTNLSPEVLRNRTLMQDVMIHHGFHLLPSEWWHFDFAGWEKYPVMDLRFEELQNK